MITEESESKEFQELFDRFWSKVDVRSKDECWNWLASTSGGRYGKFKYKGKFYSAHRFAYEFANGPIKDDLQILHKCDNEKCVNPDHLYSGTQSNNLVDRTFRDRVGDTGAHRRMYYCGEIWLMRRLIDAGTSARKVGKMFKCSYATILRIVRSHDRPCREI